MQVLPDAHRRRVVLRGVSSADCVGFGFTFKGDGKPFVWIKGFLMHPTRNVLVDGYQTRLEPKSHSKTEWRTFSIGFNPTAKSPKIQKMKVRLFAYWPNGTYYFDNVRVEEITPEEMSKLVEKRSEVK